MMNSQRELTVERPGSFIRLPMAEVCDAYLELNQSQTCIPSGACIHTSKHLTRYSHFKSHVSTRTKSRISTTIMIRVLHSNWEPHNWARFKTLSVWQPHLWGLRTLIYKEYVSASTISSTVYW